MTADYLIVILILSAGMLWSIKARKLTVPAAITGAVIGLLLFIAAGYFGLGMMTAFFIIGTAATSWKQRFKEQQGLAETNKGRRTAGQVVANAGVAGLLALCIFLFPQQSQLFTLMIAASFSSATADTVSSELGNVYGKKFYNILTIRKEQRGLDGVISFEGTAFGIIGSLIIAAIYSIGFGSSTSSFLSIILAGTLGNISDSYLGATVERGGFIGNNTVNFLNTLIAALFALLFYFL